MSKSKQALAEAILARMSLGAVPMDGLYWIDVQAARRKVTGGTVAAAEIQSSAAGEKASAAGRRASPEATGVATPRVRSKLTGWLNTKWWPLRRTGAQS